MEGFCAYCGRQLEAGETCNCREPRTYSTYGEPVDNDYHQEQSQGYNPNYNQDYHNNYSSYSNYRQGYYSTPEQFEKEQKIRKTRSLCIVSLIIGGESLVSCWSGISIVTAIIALVLAIVARKQYKENPSKLPTVALVVSILAVVLSGLFAIFFAFLYSYDFANTFFTN